jgi:hypothetical protein
LIEPHKRGPVRLYPAEIDPIVLALEVEDSVILDRDDVEFLPVDPLDVRDLETLHLQFSLHHLLKDEARMDLETPPPVEPKVLVVIEEARQ